ncbi:M23 family metallopeptidase [Fusobacterium sp.]|uniref:M23 family metallopeptidase n=1 Tax=Fusobacterium sp. TaxID=68766 RepID=UPI002611AE32|nr:M23 family metallopeptidase [Fusobacterium sp.]
MKKLILFFLIIINTFIFAKEDINISTRIVKQGGMFVVEFPKDKDYNISFKNSKIKIKSFIDGEKKKALIPVHYSTPVGTYTLKIYENKKVVVRKLVKIIDGNFKKSYITVDNSTAKKRSVQNMANMISKTSEARNNPSPKKLWEGRFIYPVTSAKDKKISSPFGAMRFVNNKVSGYHSGIDFPVAIGTPLVASNSGRVVLAKRLVTTGNTIIIDHGMNVFSAYAHMSQLNVKEGDMVKKGQNIGKSGNTGFTTGPHLHFTISIGTTFVNPSLFFNHKVLEKN